MSLRTLPAPHWKDNFKFGFPVLPEKDFRTAHGDGWQFLYAFSEQN